MRRDALHRDRSSAIRRRFADWRGDRRGVAAIEFAFCALPFFMIVFAIIETGIVLTAGVVLENGVDAVGRQILTGQLHQGETLPSKEAFSKLVCDQVSYFLGCDKLEIDLRTFSNFASIDLTYDPTDLQYVLGEGDQISVLRVYYKWEWITSFLHGLASSDDGTVLLSSVAAFQNEAFPCAACK
ncbi:TadE/TadG family type IV pilus assembly protein [Fulvimarina sp. 2208YS6-2-32]|uniref:TadE/TadG family type IV pilus assembly protein n=1 Tax=Fulvimarina uroteuthidis TaxID=3098149 RepID=A0ABU5I055_9HYPH|nr:TadE/TadG family type IV pilus assembly protein [Fulvimarina sp. 2208YS6-2-32]MDY8108695.1 TadE/TadG family type IV pilus assembly protein [Fulvimarina sp. 2208YS6-2-32]